MAAVRLWRILAKATAAAAARGELSAAKLAQLERSRKYGRDKYAREVKARNAVAAGSTSRNDLALAGVQRLRDPYDYWKTSSRIPHR